MHRLLAFVLAVALVPAVAAAAPPQPKPKGAAMSKDPAAAFGALKSRYLAGLFRAKPHLASFMGDHAADGKLPDYSPAALKKRAAELAAQQAELAKMPPTTLSADDRIDAEIIADAIGLERLYLAEIKDWEWDPRLYDSFPCYDPRELVAERLGDLMHGEFAPPAVRLTALTALLKAVPKLVAQYQKNLKNPPKLYTEKGIKDNAGRIELIKTEVADFIKQTGDAKAQKAAGAARLAALKALGAFQTFLEKDLLKRSNGEWRLGAERYRKKFPVALATRLTPDQAVARAEASLRQTRGALYALAVKLHGQMFPQQPLPGPKATPAEQAAVINRVKAEIGKDHPPAEGLVASHAAGIDRMRAFIVKHNLLALPPKDSLHVTATPLFKRGVTSAEYLAPNLLDKNAAFRATYFVDPIDPTWPKDRVESYLRSSSTAQNELTAIHEAYPGHHVQTWYSKQVPNALRTALWNAPMVEGWAVYGEDLMVGLGWGGAKNDRYRFLTLRGHLVVAQNIILDVKLHTGQMTEAEAVRFMVEEGYQEQATAEKKLTRAKFDTTQLAQYFLGWDEIRELERDVRAKQGKQFTQRAFNEALITHGSIGVKYLRAYLLPAK